MTTAPPHADEAEEAVLGAVLKAPASIARIAGILEPRDFYREQLRLIYAAMLDLHAQAQPIDYTTLAVHLRERGDYERAGGMDRLSEINLAMPTASLIEHYAAIVARFGARRRLLGAAQEIAELAWHDNPDVMTRATELIQSASSSRAHADGFGEPENRGRAVRSALGQVEYVEDLVRPGRILVVAAAEGSGKSYAIDAELGIRVAISGGTFAETWRVATTGGVLLLTEMHADDDFEREATVLAALGLERGALDERYWRQDLATAARDQPALDSAEWRSWIVDWCHQRGIIVQIFDTATGATRSNPWGQDIQATFRNLRAMLAANPALAIILIVHCKKPTGRGGARDITDVIGEWGRWCDVVLMLEQASVGHVKLSTFKRVRHPRRIVAAQRDGLLVEARDISTGSAPKVAPETFVRTVCAHPGLTQVAVAELLHVGKTTIRRYVATGVESAEIREQQAAQKGTKLLFCTHKHDSTAPPRQWVPPGGGAVMGAIEEIHRATAPATYIGGAVDGGAVSDDFYSAWADEEEER